jgi:hypothetical protein
LIVLPVGYNAAPLSSHEISEDQRGGGVSQKRLGETGKSEYVIHNLLDKQFPSMSCFVALGNPLSA